MKPAALLIAEPRVRSVLRRPEPVLTLDREGVFGTMLRDDQPIVTYEVRGSNGLSHNGSGQLVLGAPVGATGSSQRPAAFHPTERQAYDNWLEPPAILDTAQLASVTGTAVFAGGQQSDGHSNQPPPPGNWICNRDLPRLRSRP